MACDVEAAADVATRLRALADRIENGREPKWRFGAKAVLENWANDRRGCKEYEQIGSVFVLAVGNTGRVEVNVAREMLEV